MIPIRENPTAHPPFFKCLQSFEKVRIKLLRLAGPGNLLNSMFYVVSQYLAIMWVQYRSSAICTHIFLSYCNRSTIAELSPSGGCSTNGAELGSFRALSLHLNTLKKGRCGLHPHIFNLLESRNKRRISRFASRPRVRVCGAKAPPTLSLYSSQIVRTTHPRPLPLTLWGQGARRCHNQLLRDEPVNRRNQP